MRKIVLIPSAGGAFAEGPVLWACRSETGFERGVLSSFAALDELEAEENDEVALIVSGSDIVIHGVDVPARAEAQARLAASFALEDELAVDQEDLFFALGPPAEAGWNRSVAVVAAAKLEGWLSALKAVGISPSILIPDYLLLPAEEKTLRILERGGLVTLRGGENLGLTIEAGLLPLILPDILRRAEIDQVEIASDDPASLAPEGGWGARRVTEVSPLSDEDFVLFALDNLERGKCLNLLQGAYAPQRSAWRGFEVWKRAAALAAAISIAYVGLLAVEGWHYASEAGLREARAEEVLRAAFPDIDRVVNPRAQMRARLTSGGGNADQFFDLAALVYGAADGLPTVEVQGMQYDILRGDLAVDIAFQAYPDLEQLKSAIVGTGGSVEEGGSRQQGNWIVGEIRVAQR